MMRQPNEQQKQAARERVQQLQAAGKSLIAELAKGHTQAFDRYIDFTRRFHAYSWHNQACIYWQRPEASYVAGYEAWIDQHKRHVVKGAKALWILAPCIAKRETETEDGETEVQAVRFFRAAAVFDVADTVCLHCDLADCPEHPLPDWHQDVAGDAGALNRLLAACPYPVQFEPMTASINQGCKRGWTDGRVLHIEQNMGAGSQVGTLSHEWTHALLHFGQDRPERPQCELEAEMAAHMVCRALGVERSSRDYLLSWLGGQPNTEIAPKALGLALERSTKAAQTITTTLLGQSSGAAILNSQEISMMGVAA